MAKYEGRYENLEHIGIDHGLAEWIESLTLEWRHDYSANYEDYPRRVLPLVAGNLG